MYLKMDHNTCKEVTLVTNFFCIITMPVSMENFECLFKNILALPGISYYTIKIFVWFIIISTTLKNKIEIVICFLDFAVQKLYMCPLLSDLWQSMNYDIQHVYLEQYILSNRYNCRPFISRQYFPCHKLYSPYPFSCYAFFK